MPRSLPRPPRPPPDIDVHGFGDHFKIHINIKTKLFERFGEYSKACQTISSRTFFQKVPGKKGVGWRYSPAGRLRYPAPPRSGCRPCVNPVSNCSNIKFPTSFKGSYRVRDARKSSTGSHRGAPWRSVSQ